MVNPGDIHRAFMQAHACIQEYYDNGGEGRCPEAYPHQPIGGFLERANELKVDFAMRAQTEARRRSEAAIN